MYREKSLLLLSDSWVLIDIVPQEKAGKTQHPKMKGLALWQVTPKSTVCLDKTQRTHGTNHRWSKI